MMYKPQIIADAYFHFDNEDIFAIRNVYYISENANNIVLENINKEINKHEKHVILFNKISNYCITWRNR